MAKPEKHVFVCVQGPGPGHPNRACIRSGAASLWDEFASVLLSRGLHGRVALSHTGCLGPCKGPHVLVYPEGVMYGEVRHADVSAIVDEHLIGGKPVKHLLVSSEVWG